MAKTMCCSCCSYPSISYIINREILSKNRKCCSLFICLLHIYKQTLYCSLKIYSGNIPSCSLYVHIYIYLALGHKHTYYAVQESILSISMYCIKLTSAQACILPSPKYTQCKNNAVHNLYISRKQVFYPRKINNVNTLHVHIHRSSTYLLSVKNRPAKHNSILLLYVTLMSSPAIIKLSQKN
jgi:hypothetical protein